MLCIVSLLRFHFADPFCCQKVSYAIINAYILTQCQLLYPNTILKPFSYQSPCKPQSCYKKNKKHIRSKSVQLNSYFRTITHLSRTSDDGPNNSASAEEDSSFSGKLGARTWPISLNRLLRLRLNVFKLGDLGVLAGVFTLLFGFEYNVFGVFNKLLYAELSPEPGAPNPLGSGRGILMSSSSP